MGKAGVARSRINSHTKAAREAPAAPAAAALTGMLLHIDASKHAWFGDGRHYDLITILDDAASKIYYAQLVEEAGTRTLMPVVREVIETQAIFCALYSDRASHFFVTSQAAGQVDPHQLTPVGRLHRLDLPDPQLLRQPPLPSAIAALHRPRACGE